MDLAGLSKARVRDRETLEEMSKQKSRPWPRSYFSMNRLGDDRMLVFGGETCTGEKQLFLDDLQLI